jgi:hypothetical protein
VQSGGLVINALPWAVVLEVVDEEGKVLDLPSDHHTPMFLDLPAGSYSVSLRPPEGGPPVQIETVISGDEPTRIEHQFNVLDVDGFLERYGFSK